MLFSSLPCYLDALRPKYSPHHYSPTHNELKRMRKKSVVAYLPVLSLNLRTEPQKLSVELSRLRNKQLRNLCNKHAYYPLEHNTWCYPLEHNTWCYPLEHNTWCYPLEHNTWCYPLFTPDVYELNFCWQFRFIPQFDSSPSTLFLLALSWGETPECSPREISCRPTTCKFVSRLRSPENSLCYCAYVHNLFTKT
jgi:hypothetical protein